MLVLVLRFCQYTLYRYLLTVRYVLISVNCIKRMSYLGIVFIKLLFVLLLLLLLLLFVFCFQDSFCTVPVVILYPL